MAGWGVWSAALLRINDPVMASQQRRMLLDCCLFLHRLPYLLLHRNNNKKHHKRQSRCLVSGHFPDQDLSLRSALWFGCLSLWVANGVSRQRGFHSYPGPSVGSPSDLLLLPSAPTPSFPIQSLTLVVSFKLHHFTALWYTKAADIVVTDWLCHSLVTMMKRGRFRVKPLILIRNWNSNRFIWVNFF